tara:strand:+ start:13363 stop:14118 length:756 start_codon:yes stop_codon:yes gene_type:complete
MNKKELEKTFGLYQNTVNHCQFEEETLKRHFSIIKENLAGKKILEVGCGVGTFSMLISSCTKDLTIIDGSQGCLDHTKQKLENSNADMSSIKFIESLWGEFDSDEKYSDIIFLRGAEHIDDPAIVINSLKKFLLPKGRFHISVPNGRSFHRKVGVHLDLLDIPESFTEGDYSVGHRHVFDYWTLRNILVNECQMNIKDFKGVMMKFLSNAQMNKLFVKYPNLPLALHQAAQETPHVCAEIYFCVVKNEENI